MTPSETAKQYAHDVVTGEIPAGPFVRMACSRFLDDLVRAETRHWPYRYDEAAADRAVKFMELMPHTKGKWAASNETLKLMPWQRFIECNLFGWLHKQTGLRRFRQCYEEVPRKNGKSAKLAARGLYLFCADREPAAEVYSGATTEKQAYEIFRPAWAMAYKLEGLRKRFDISLSGNPKNPRTMFVLSDMSKFETMIGKPGDGSSPHAALIDEYHEHDTDHMVDAMQTGMGARQQPLLSIVTTAGTNLGGPCYEKRRDVIAILEGKVTDETIFGYIAGLDDDDDWADPANLKKANPNYGVSVFEDFLLAQLEEARRSASKQVAFRTKHLNQWVGARALWMNMLSWQRQKKPFTAADMAGYPCWIGVDLASKKDVAAVVRVWKVGADFYIKPKFYVPSAAAEDNHKYRDFAASGDLLLTPGAMTDFAFIEEDLKAMCKESDVRDIAFDAWQANYLITRLLAEGLPVVEFNQTVRNMSEPMKELDARITARRCWHDGNPVMTWMIGNVSCRMDAKENIYPRKENERDPLCKIDGPVAMIMAMGRALQDNDDGAGFNAWIANPVGSR